jgi:WD40 repeat protein
VRRIVLPPIFLFLIACQSDGVLLADANKEHLQDDARIEKLLSDLESDEPAVRARAQEELVRAARRARPQVLRFKEKTRDPDLLATLEFILNRIDCQYSPRRLGNANPAWTSSRPILLLEFIESGSSKLLVTAGNMGDLEARDLKTGNVIAKLKLPSPNANWMAIASHKNSLASAANDGTLRVWRPDTNECTTLPTKLEKVVAIQLSASHLLCATDDTLYSFQLGKDDSLRKLPLSVKVKDLAVCADGRAAVLSFENEVLWVSLTDWIVVDRKMLPPPARGQAVISKDHGHLVVVDIPKSTVSILAIDDLRLVGQQKTVTASASFAYVPALKRLVQCGDGEFSVSNPDGSSVKSWKTSSRSGKYPIMAQSPGSTLLAVGMENGNIRVIDLEALIELTPIDRHIGAVHYGLFVSKTDLLVTSAADAKTVLWDLASARAVRTYPSQIDAATYNPDSKTFVALPPMETRPVRFTVENDEIVPLKDDKHWSHRNLMMPLAVSSTFRFAIEQDSSSYFLLDATKPGTKSLITGPKHTLSLALFSSDESHIVLLWSFPVAGKIGIWDIAQSQTRALTPTHKVTPTTRVATCAQARRIAIVDQKCLQLVDSELNKEVLFESDKRLTSVAVSNDGRFAFAGREDGSIYILNFGGTVLNTLPSDSASPVTTISLDVDGCRLLAGTENGFVTIWQR